MSLFNQLFLSVASLLGAAFWAFCWYMVPDSIYGVFVAGMLTISALHFHAWLYEETDNDD